MPVLVAWIGDMLVTYIGQIVVSALLSLGIGFLASKVGAAVFDYTPIRAAFGQAGQVMMNYAGFFGIDQAMTIVLSAWMGRRATEALQVHLAARSSSSSTGST